ncbi:MAG TPA: hypothetical protein VGH54_10405 [Mycobacterium sp.]|jgi:hypothetical protein
MPEVIDNPLTPVIVAPGIMMWRDSHQVLHMKDQWPDQIVCSPALIAEY